MNAAKAMSDLRELLKAAKAGDAPAIDRLWSLWGFISKDRPADVIASTEQLIEYSTAKTPEKSKETRLLEFVQAQIQKLRIGCRESVHQCDHVILGAYEFIEGCCEIVGYMEADDESI